MRAMVDSIESIRPAADGKCICGKNKLFKNCCGSLSPRRNIPFGMILEKGFLSAELCDRLVKYASEQLSANLETISSNTQDESGYLKTEKTLDRVCERVELGSKQDVINRWVEKIFENYLPKKIKRKTKSHSPPDLMRYDVGGFYKRHSDSEVFNTATGRWERVIDRDYSLLLYLNDDFEGGAVHFTLFNYTYKPSKGDLLLFPSNHLYLHEAQAVESGVRFVIVSWAALA